MDSLECMQCDMWSGLLVSAEGHIEGGSAWRNLWCCPVRQSSLLPSSMSWSVLWTCCQMWWIFHKCPESDLIIMSFSPVVHGHWSEWTEWSECDAQCGGGVKQRNRTCTAPPPKNGGRDCAGMTLQSQTCNSQPCTKDTGTQTGDSPNIKFCLLCLKLNQQVFFSSLESSVRFTWLTCLFNRCRIKPVNCLNYISALCKHTNKLTLCSGCLNGMVLVTEADCQAGRVKPCPPTCAHLSMTGNCTAACVLGRTLCILYCNVAFKWKVPWKYTNNSLNYKACTNLESATANKATEYNNISSYGCLASICSREELI